MELTNKWGRARALLSCEMGIENPENFRQIA
jgi:hypothetical protein